jgi:hypothetical protein
MIRSVLIFLALYIPYAVVILLIPGTQPFWITLIVSLVIGAVSGHLGAVIENKRNYPQ